MKSSIAKHRDMVAWRSYIAIARPDHWFKNVFVLPGAAVAILLTNEPIQSSLWPLLIGLVSTCLVASANYTINEWLDREFDRHHPSKKRRPSAIGSVRQPWVTVEYLMLAAIGLWLGSLLNFLFVTVSIALLVMGLLYNVKPFRTKDRVYLDVLSESVNNPLRFLLGWSAVTEATFPPSSILLAYWMGGAFLMAIKRFSEYRFIGDPERAGLYRRSFQFYTEEKLLVSSFFYALSSALFLGVFLIKYRVEFLLSFPLFALLFAWYLDIGLRTESAAQAPERLYREKRFVAFVVLLVAAVGLLFVFDIPWLNILLETVQY